MTKSEHDARLRTVDSITEILLSFVLNSGEIVDVEELRDSLRLTSEALLEDLNFRVINYDGQTVTASIAV